jgi:hypothetical protein
MNPKAPRLIIHLLISGDLLQPKINTDHAADRRHEQALGYYLLDLVQGVEIAGLAFGAFKILELGGLPGLGFETGNVVALLLAV